MEYRQRRKKIFKMAKIGFVPTGDERLASFRYRISIPSRALEERGHTIKLVVGPDPHADCEFLIYSKHFNPLPDQQGANIARRKGIKVVFDICDNHFQNPNPQISGHYKIMCEVASIITCNSETMQKIIYQNTGETAKIVDDPYDLEEREAQFRYDEQPIKVLWYGHAVNLNTIPLMAQQLSQIDCPIEVVALSNAPQPPGKLDNVTVLHHAWSPEHMKVFLEWCNFVSIPSDTNDPRKITKSHNRVTEGIRSGRFVCAHPLPSYERYRERYAWVGEDISDGVIWADNHPDEALEKIRKGQEYIRRFLSPLAIAEQWEKALGVGPVRIQT